MIKITIKINPEKSKNIKVYLSNVFTEIIIS